MGGGVAVAYMAAGRAGHRPLARTFMAGMAQRGGDVMSHQTLPICSRMPALKVLDRTAVGVGRGIRARRSRRLPTRFCRNLLQRRLQAAAPPVLAPVLVIGLALGSIWGSHC